MRLSLGVPILLLLVSLAGCAAPPPVPCEPKDCPPLETPPTTAAPTESPVPVPIVLLPPAPRLLRWEGCTGLTFNVELLYEQARAAVPPEFLPRGKTPDTATLAVEAVACSEASHATRTFGEVRYVQAALNVVPLNETWVNGSSISRFLVSAFVDSADLALELDSWGAPVVAADIRSAEATPDGALVSWSVEHDGERWTFDNRRPLGANAESDGRSSQWFERDGLRRLEIQQWYAFHDGLDAGVLVLEGDGPLHRLAEADHLPWTGQAFHHLSRSFHVAIETYGGT